MRIGILSGDFTPSDTDNLFAKIKNLGFVSTQLAFASLSEINFVPDGEIEIPVKVENNIIDRINKSAEAHGIDIIANTGTFNMAHPDKRVRDEGVRRFEYLAEASANLGCKIISLCTGSRNKEHLWRYHPDNSTPEAWSDMTETMKRCVDIAEKYDIVLAAETEMANIIDSPEKARRIMDEVGSPNLKMIMDCANLFPAGKAKKENVRKTVQHAFDIFGADVILAHGKDIKESEESKESEETKDLKESFESGGIKFCATGEGIVDYKQFAELLRRHNYKNDMILHGIFDEAKMPYAIEVIKRAVGTTI